MQFFHVRHSVFAKLLGDPSLALSDLVAAVV